MTDQDAPAIIYVTYQGTPDTRFDRGLLCRPSPAARDAVVGSATAWRAHPRSFPRSRRAVRSRSANAAFRDAAAVEGGVRCAGDAGNDERCGALYRRPTGPGPGGGDLTVSFWENTPPRTVRRGHLWITGDRIERGRPNLSARSTIRGKWETPEAVTQPWPIVLVHGGGYQGTEWLDTPDGRPGWQQRLVEAGYATVTVDRPGQGRSPFHVDTIGPMGPTFSYEGWTKDLHAGGFRRPAHAMAIRIG